MSQPRPVRNTLPVGDLDPFVPTAERPVRQRPRALPYDTHIEPHRHPWAQLAYCTRGVIQVGVTLDDGPETTFVIPPSRALWIPAGALHAVTVLEAADLRTLYIEPSAIPAGWTGCHVLLVSPLLRELIGGVDTPRNLSQPGRLPAFNLLLLDEIVHADTQALGVPLPRHGGDRRLRALCEAVLRAPAEQARLADWAAQVGASERTMTRLFREELGTSYQQWRTQVLLAHALPMLARGQPVSQVAEACGYASDSAFSAMFKAAMGQPPSQFGGRLSLTI